MIWTGVVCISKHKRSCIWKYWFSVNAGIIVTCDERLCERLIRNRLCWRYRNQLFESANRQSIVYINLFWNVYFHRSRCFDRSHRNRKQFDDLILEFEFFICFKCRTISPMLANIAELRILKGTFQWSNADGDDWCYCSTFNTICLHSFLLQDNNKSCLFCNRIYNEIRGQLIMHHI